ncbi:FecR family protein [Draconibacterium sediminis]|uniref:FecR protein domain-containing protein n=1 Tax=Draconibacterium sediminis TaxID=1544798 RepID=A0A0D8JHP4_9BACT|nr:FecR family protein [Draconibacterium sediminis]KJF45368.1 hypothetical protein LH29_08340 [Draconibacterium sediminis]
MTRLQKNKILTKYFNGGYSLSDYLQLKSWFENDSDFSELGEIIAEKWEKEEPSESENLSDEVFGIVRSAIGCDEKKEKNHRSISNLFFKVAAALVIGLLGGYFISYLMPDKYEPVIITARAPKGSLSETVLPDGTLIILNAGSELQYTVGENNQVNEVSLIGEAWFDVYKNPQRKFIVKTPFYHVNVLGTQFNVKAYREDKFLETTLVEGQVEITSSARIKLAAPLNLKPGEQFAFQKETKSGIIRQVNTKIFTSWKDNKLIFINMDLQELFVLLERKFGVEIEVISPEILDFHYTGSIKNESFIEILDLISLTLPIEYEIIGQQIKISRTK